MRGPGTLFAAWALHDIEEALAFPSSCDKLAEATGIESLRMSPAQSWAAVGMAGAVVATASIRGARTRGRSSLYRAVIAGLESHVATYVGMSLLAGGYSAGMVTAVTVMLPGTRYARLELARNGAPLTRRDTAVGLALLGPVALGAHVASRLLLSGRAVR